MKEKSNTSKKNKPLTIFITGGSSGIGYQAVLKLISLGHNIILPCKNISRANEVLTNLFNHSLDESSNKGEIYTPIMDLSDLSSIDSLCSEVKNRRWTIDVLILNAGLQYTGSKTPRRSTQGIELTFAVNHLSHFYLTQKILPFIDIRNDPKIIITSSEVHNPMSSGGKVGAKASLGNLSGLSSGTVFDMIDGDKLKPSALLDIDKYALRGPGGDFEFEEVQINDKQKRKFHKFDKDKILQKVDPFLRAEIAGIMENESSAVAAWNMFIGSKITGEKDAQREVDATAGDNSWSYDLLPLDAKHKRDFYEGYKEYFFDNYLKAFTENIIPEGAEGAIQNIGTQAVKDQVTSTTDQLKDISAKQQQQPQSEAFKRLMQDLNAL